MPDAGSVRTPGECLTLGGHDGSPCSFCGRIARKRPPPIPKAALERERARHPDRSSHFHSAHNDGR
jgi:hypothetical protein